MKGGGGYSAAGGTRKWANTRRTNLMGCHFAPRAASSGLGRAGWRGEGWAQGRRCGAVLACSRARVWGPLLCGQRGAPVPRVWYTHGLPHLPPLPLPLRTPGFLLYPGGGGRGVQLRIQVCARALRARWSVRAAPVLASAYAVVPVVTKLTQGMVTQRCSTTRCSLRRRGSHSRASCCTRLRSRLLPPERGPGRIRLRTTKPPQSGLCC